MRWLERQVHASLRREAGQTLALFAAGAIGAAALVGMVVDAGLVLGTRAELQNAADAAALAGAQDLPNAGIAMDAAHSYVHRNADWGTGHQISVYSEDAINDTMVVRVNRRVDFTFLRVLGLSGTTVRAEAISRRGYYSGGTGILPFGFIASDDPTSTLLQNDCYLGSDLDGLPIFAQGRECRLKYGAGTNSGGDFGALGLDGTGAQDYEDAIINGSVNPIRVGHFVNPETGNMVGPTRSGLRDRLSRPAPPGCAGNEMSDVLTTNANGSVTVTPGCELSARLIVIPVVDKIENPDMSEVLGFAIIFLTGQSNSGGHLQLHGQFITLVSPLTGGQYTGTHVNDSTAAFLVDSCSVCGP